MSDVKQVFQHLASLLQRGEVEEAANFYSRVSEDVGYTLVQRMPADPALRVRLAKMFFIAKDFQKAALIFEQSGEPEKAACLYEKADDYGMAAEMYARSRCGTRRHRTSSAMATTRPPPSSTSGSAIWPGRLPTSRRPSTTFWPARCISS